MPAAAPVEELASPWPQKRNEVLEIRRGARSRSERGRIQRAARGGNEHETRGAARDLEAARVDVLVWDAITGEMKHGSE